MPLSRSLRVWRPRSWRLSLLSIGRQRLTEARPGMSSFKCNSEMRPRTEAIQLLVHRDLSHSMSISRVATTRHQFHFRFRVDAAVVS